MKNKICTRCKKEKKTTEFCKDKSLKSGIASSCKNCRNSLKRKWTLENKEKLTAYNKKYYEDNKESELLRIKNYQRINKEKISLKRASSERDKYYSDSLYNFKERLRKLLRLYFIENKIPKKSKTFQMLGYSPKNLNEHLNSWLNKPCEDCNDTIISIKNSHIDHIRPISLAKTKDGIIKLNQLNNLRLVCPSCNLKKGSKI